MSNAVAGAVAVHPDSPSSSHAPEQSWRRIRPLIPKRLQPLLRGLRKRYQRIFLDLEEPYRSVFPYTQSHPVRQRSLVDLGRTIDRERIPGAIVECGVLDGGTAALMGWATNASTPPRELHLFDAWEGLPETTPEDGGDAAVWTGQVVGSPTRVRTIMDKLAVARSRIHVHRGWFDQTFPTVEVPQVALAHVDCDFYEPTRLCLEKWYPVLSPGGFMQFDDYAAFSGCQRAVDEFLALHPELRLEAIGDGAKAYVLRKPTHTGPAL
jgi:O-methyltransferase